MGTTTAPPAALEKLFETSHDANLNDVLGKTKPEHNNMSSTLDHQLLDEDAHSATDLKALQQERSSDSSGDIEAGRAQYDPAFTVGWDGGDSDPENPRSLPVLRKWAIVLITSAGSFCV
ncbi:hypothetical protein Cpir12675_002206 [Ceratocystis pirilliformis]|uniref:Uncharacterized protein n=1 Tax=Ceratocystis pirilliformis TaxID=259994 RepID=A0ABR3ZAU0_9PEZI